MPADPIQPPRGPSDATDYSSTKAPETRDHAEERDGQPSDPRLIPGGAHGAAADPGMSSLDRDVSPSGGRTTGQQKISDTRGDREG
jgi:hypothetical protein